MFPNTTKGNRDFCVRLFPQEVWWATLTPVQRREQHSMQHISRSTPAQDTVAEDITV